MTKRRLKMVLISVYSISFIGLSYIESTSTTYSRLAGSSKAKRKLGYLPHRKLEAYVIEMMCT